MAKIRDYIESEDLQYLDEMQKKLLEQMEKNVSGLGVTAIKKDVDLDIEPGDIKEGDICHIRYDGVYSQLVDAFQQTARDGARPRKTDEETRD